MGRFMARVLFAEFSNVNWVGKAILDSHAQSFVDSLCNLGNDVMVIVGNGLTIGFLYNELKWAFIEKVQIKRKVQNFNPDLIISYNNFLPDGIIQNTNCPIIIYPADIVSSWAGVEYISKYIDRYYFLETTSAITKQLKTRIPNVNDNRIIPFGHATGVKRTIINQDINISFVGSILNYSYNIVNYFAELGNIKDEKKIEYIHGTFCREFADYYENRNAEFDCLFFHENYLEKIQKYEASCMAFCNKRFEVLSKVCDLGLKIYGWPSSWASVMMYNFNIWKCFDYHTSVTLEDSIETYNRSKISLNLPQGSNTDGFSWRVTDILASNAVLLSVKKKDLVNLMSPYYKDMPYYESSAEAREIAKKLLAEDQWRKEIVEASNCMVEEKCRFEKKIKVIEEAITNLDLVKKNKGNQTVLSAEDVCKPMPQIERVLRNYTIIKRFLKSIYDKAYTNRIVSKTQKNNISNQ